MKTKITFHFYYPYLMLHDSAEIIYNCSELQARKEAMEFSKELSDCFTHIESKVL